MVGLNNTTSPADPGAVRAASPPGAADTETTETGREEPIAEAPAEDTLPEESPPADVEEAATVPVRIVATPAEAEILLDDEALPNPFVGDLPRSSEPRQLVVQADGYETAERSLSLTQGQQVELALTRAQTARPRPRPRPRPAATPTPVARPVARPTTGTRAASGSSFGL